MLVERREARIVGEAGLKYNAALLLASPTPAA